MQSSPLILLLIKTDKRYCQWQKNITRCKQNRAVLFCMVLYTFFTISSIITMYNLHFIDENKGNISQIFAIIFLQNCTFFNVQLLSRLYLRRQTVNMPFCKLARFAQSLAESTLMQAINHHY